MRWVGQITEVDGDEFTALLKPVDRAGPELVAEFGIATLPSKRRLEPDLLFEVPEMRLIVESPLSVEDIERIKAAAKAHLERLRPLMD